MSPTRITQALVAVAFLWGFSEATWFFVIPDVFLTFVALLAWRQSGWCLAAVLCGTMLGACLVHSFHAWDWPALWSSLPGYRNGMTDLAEQQIREGGASAIRLGPLNGIPYRYYIWVAANQEVSLGSLLLATPLARIPRMILAVLAAAGVARLSRKWLSKEIPATSWVLVWVPLYAFYWGYFLPHTYP